MKTLDGEPVLFHPSCFYLDGYQARWITPKELPAGAAVWNACVNWKSMRMDVTVCTNVPCNPGKITLENPCSNKDYLKSHLQKAIRRSNVYRALKTAIHHMDVSMQDFLRRLAIIAIEDALPLDGYSTLVWFMVANSKGYELSFGQICWCLGYAMDLARCPSRDIYPPTPTGRPRTKSLPPAGKDLVYSILFRQAYGGMDGDQDMLNRAAGLWTARYHTGSLYVSNLSRKQIFVTPPTSPLHAEEWYLAAIDFHCCPNIIFAILENHEIYSEEDIRTTIWYCSSSITDKKYLSGEPDKSVEQKYRDIWQVIERDCRRYAYSMLQRTLAPS